MVPVWIGGHIQSEFVQNSAASARAIFAVRVGFKGELRKTKLFLDVHMERRVNMKMVHHGTFKLFLLRLVVYLSSHVLKFPL